MNTLLQIIVRISFLLISSLLISKGQIYRYIDTAKYKDIGNKKYVSLQHIFYEKYRFNIEINSFFNLKNNNNNNFLIKQIIKIIITRYKK